MTAGSGAAISKHLTISASADDDAAGRVSLIATCAVCGLNGGLRLRLQSALHAEALSVIAGLDPAIHPLRKMFFEE